MRTLIISLLLVAAYDATGQITAGQIRGVAPFDSIQLLVNDTVTSSPYYKRGKWASAYAVIAAVADSLGIGEAWLRVSDDGLPTVLDSVYHIGPVTIGDDTTLTGALNVIGRIDQRMPAGKVNVAIGRNAMSSGSVTGEDNVAVGATAMRDLTSGEKNSALGAGALQEITTGAGNLGVGESALAAVTTGENNVGVGRLSIGQAGSDADGNVAIGYEALTFCSTDFNVAIGYQAIGGFDFAFTGTTGNVAIGPWAGYGFAGGGNVAIGDSAGYSWAGNDALFIDNSPTAAPLVRGDFAQDTFHINGELGFRDDPGGANALALMAGRKLSRGTVGYGLVLAGDSLSVDAVALADSIGGGGSGDPSVWYETGAVPADNIADEIYHTGDVHIGDATMAGGGRLNVLGYADFRYPSVSLYNIGIGLNALDASMTGNNNIALGQSALTAITSGSHNYAFGEGALASLTTGEGNTAIGFNAGNAITTGGYSFLAGFQAGTSFTGSNAVAIGFQALMSNVSGFGNVAIGDRALKAATGGYNVALGAESALKLTTGQKNMAIGASAIRENTTGNDNVGIGTSALQNTTSGYQNVAIGTNALLGGAANGAYNNVGIGNGAGEAVTGNSNVYVGAGSMAQNTGNENVGIGTLAGYNNLSGSGNVFIGTTAGYNETGSNKLYVDNSTTSSPLIHGDFSTNELFINGKLGYSTEGSTATTLAGRDASEDFTDVTIGTGLSLSGGTLSNTGIITEVDGSITNEGSLTVGAGTGTTSLIQSNTSGSTAVTLQASGIITLAEAGNTITIGATETDGSVTNEGTLGVGAGGATSSTITTNTSGGNAVTINAAGILSISESTSSNGGSITLTATEVDGSTTNELNVIEEGNVAVQSGNISIDFQSMFDVAADGGTEVNVSIDHGEATTVTSSETDDWMLMYDAGLARTERMLWTDFLIDLITFKEGNTGVGTGDAIDFGEGFDLTMSPSSEANVTLDFSEFTTDAAPEGDEFVILSDGAGTQEKVAITYFTSGGSDGNGIYTGDGTVPGDVDATLTDSLQFIYSGEPLLTLRNGRVGIGTGTGGPSTDFHIRGVQGSALHEGRAGSAPTWKLLGRTDGAGSNALQGTIQMNYADADYASGVEQNAVAMRLRKESDAAQWTTYSVVMEENTDANVIVAEKQADFTNNTTESHVSINGGIAFTQNYDGSTGGANLQLDRSYYIVNITGGNLTDTLKLPEVVSNSDNWDGTMTAAQCQVGQTYVITNFRASTALVIGGYNVPAGTSNDDSIDNAGAISLPVNNSVIIKCVRYNGTKGFWYTYD